MELLVEALTLAAKMQNRQAAGRLALGAVAVAALIAIIGMWGSEA